MDTWIIFWKYLYLIGMTSFYLMVIVIAPLGFIDIFKLFKKLNEK